MSRLGAIPGSRRPSSIVRPGSQLPGGQTAGGFGVKPRPGQNYPVNYLGPPAVIGNTRPPASPYPGATPDVAPNGGTVYRPPINPPARQPTSNPWGTPPAQPAPTNGQGGQIMPGTGSPVPTQTPQGYPINTFMGGGGQQNQQAFDYALQNGMAPPPTMGGPFATPGFNPNGSTLPEGRFIDEPGGPVSAFQPGQYLGANGEGIRSAAEYNQAMQGMGNVAEQLAQPYGPGSQNPDRPLPNDALDLAPPQELMGNQGIDVLPPLPPNVPFGGGNQQLPGNGMQLVGPPLQNPFQNMPQQRPFGQGGQQPQRPLAGQGAIPGSRPPSGVVVPGNVFGLGGGYPGGQTPSSPVGNVGSVNPQGIGPISNPQQNPLNPIGNAAGNNGQGGPFNNNWDGGRAIMANQYQQQEQATQQRVAADMARRMAEAEAQAEQRLDMQSQYPEGFDGMQSGSAAGQGGMGAYGFVPVAPQGMSNVRDALLGSGGATSLSGRRQTSSQQRLAGVSDAFLPSGGATNLRPHRQLPAATTSATPKPAYMVDDRPPITSIQQLLNRMTPAELNRWYRFGNSVK